MAVQEEARYASDERKAERAGRIKAEVSKWAGISRALLLLSTWHALVSNQGLSETGVSVQQPQRYTAVVHMC